jgi:quercetin dioxygenase-like cupin family protein
MALSSPSPEEKARDGRPIFGSAVKVDIGAESAYLKKDDSWHENGHSGKTLFKYADFRVVLTGLKAGSRMSEHHTNHRVTVQVIDGRVRLQLPDGVVELLRGDLLAIDRDVPHEVQAVEDSVLLLSVAWSNP